MPMKKLIISVPDDDVEALKDLAYQEYDEGGERYSLSRYIRSILYQHLISVNSVNISKKTIIQKNKKKKSWYQRTNKSKPVLTNNIINDEEKKSA